MSELGHLPTFATPLRHVWNAHTTQPNAYALPSPAIQLRMALTAIVRRFHRRGANDQGFGWPSILRCRV